MTNTKKAWISIIALGALGVIVALGFAAINPVVSLAAAPAQQSTPTAPNTPGGNGQAPADLSQYYDLFWQNLATRLNTTVDKLKAAITGAAGDTIDQAQKDGKVTSDQATQLKNHFNDELNSGKGFPFEGFGFGGRGRGHGKEGWGGFGGFGENKGFLMNEFAKYLNTDTQSLMTELQGGKTLADVAKEKNVDINTVKQSVLNDYKTELDTHVKNNQLTQAQADQALQNLSTKLDTLVNQQWNQKFFHGPFGPGNNNPQTAPSATPSGTGG